MTRGASLESFLLYNMIDATKTDKRYGVIIFSAKNDVQCQDIII